MDGDARSYLKTIAVLVVLLMQYGSCAAGDDCPFSHNTFEMSLHPERYECDVANA
jgi:hypothetical protein